MSDKIKEAPLLDILVKNIHKKEIYTADLTAVESLLQEEEAFLWFDIVVDPGEQPSEDVLVLLRDILKIHDLNIEDCILTSNFPKLEEYSDYLFMVFTQHNYDTQKRSKFVIILGHQYILTYKHSSDKEIETIKERFKCHPNKFRDTIQIFNNVVTKAILQRNNQIILEYEKQLDKFEDRLFENFDDKNLVIKLNSIRIHLIRIREYLSIENDMLYDLITGYETIIPPRKSIYIRDLYDNVDRMVSKIDNLKETIFGILGMQITFATNRVNEFIKFISLVTAVLLPITMVSSVFGMNFVNIPLLHDHYGFYYAFAIMAVFSLVLFGFFRYMKWI